MAAVRPPLRRVGSTGAIGENVTSSLQVRLANDAGTPERARTAVGAWLAETHVQSPTVLRTAELVTSELVTNALVHAHAAPVLTAERSGEGIVRITVHDSSRRRWPANHTVPTAATDSTSSQRWPWRGDGNQHHSANQCGPTTLTDIHTVNAMETDTANSDESALPASAALRVRLTATPRHPTDDIAAVGSVAQLPEPVPKVSPTYRSQHVHHEPGPHTTAQRLSLRHPS